ncbi:MAG TPA: alkaline phosphatase D family protein [Acidimicrobiales bacterium]
MTITESDLPAVGEAPFTHGVASFDPTSDGVLLWTRAPGAGRLRWRIATGPGAEPAAQGEVAVPADRDHCVTVAVDGLAPANSYVFWFEAGPTRSPVGRTHTLPAAGTDPVRLAVVSCGDYSRGHFAAYRAVAEADVDLVLHVGDYIYETAGKDEVRTALPDHDVVTLDDYRTRHRQTRGDADLIALHLRHPVVAIWDDHDIADNAWRHGSKHHDPNEHGRWEDRLRAAATARQEWVPSRLPDPDDLLTVYRSFAIGDLAELVLLDTRIAGRDQQADDDPALPYDDPDRSMLGDRQRRWAHERVGDTSRPWCLLVTQVVLNRMALPVRTGGRLGDLAPSGYAVIGGRAMCTDEWDGYPAERDALARAIASRGPGVVALSGDVHSAWAFEGPCLDGDPVAVELVVPCVSATPMGRQLPRGWRKLLGMVADQLPEARWFELERHGFLVVEVDGREVRAHWFAVDTEDATPRPDPVAAWRHRRFQVGRLEPLDADGGAPGGVLAVRPPRDGARPRPQVPVPDRPPEVAGGTARRRARRRRLARLAVAGAAGVLAAAGVHARRRRRT